MKRSRLPWIVAGAALFFLYLPILVLVANSFNASRFGGSWQGFSLAWYARLFREPEIWRAARTTLVIALGATGLAGLLGTTAALALHRYARSRLQRAHFALIYTPLIMPEILMGIGLLMVFSASGLGLGMGTIFLAHVTFCLSFVAMVVLARLQDFDESVIEASRDLGAGSWMTFRRIRFPLIAPGVAAGCLLAFTLSVDDFVITFFVAGPGSTTLPVRIYSMIKHGSPPLINALSTILLVVTFAALAVSQRLSRPAAGGGA
jgi:spermidine/putrescine transport system permease protein